MTIGDNACKMQALWGCLEDEMMILIEGSLVGRDGGKGILGILMMVPLPKWPSKF